MIRIGSLCSGYTGLDMAISAVLGGELAWVADNDAGPVAILAHHYPHVPNLGDITAIDWAAVPPVDILGGGFPCENVSCAGGRAGLRQGTSSGVWSSFPPAIAVLRPRLVVIENVGGLLSAGADSNMEPCPWCLGEAGDEHVLRAAGAVLGDLASIGYDARWTVVSAAEAGAPHLRKRVFILGWPAANTEAADAGWRLIPGTGARRLPAVWREAGAESGNGYGSPPQDADRATGRERRQPAPGQAPGRRPRADAGGSGGARTAADTAGDGHGDTGPGSGRRLPAAPVAGAFADATGDQPAEPDAGITGDDQGDPRPGSGTGDRQPLADADDGRRRAGEPHDDARQPDTDWGAYAGAVRRWESVTGRRVPRPTEPGRTGERLSPRFVEWMMGLPDGWVTSVPGLSRNAQLKALGKGVVPQQAVLALRHLLAAEGSEAAA